MSDKEFKEKVRRMGERIIEAMAVDAELDDPNVTEAGGRSIDANVAFETLCGVLASMCVSTDDYQECYNECLVCIAETMEVLLIREGRLLPEPG